MDLPETVELSGSIQAEANDDLAGVKIGVNSCFSFGKVC